MMIIYAINQMLGGWRRERLLTVTGAVGLLLSLFCALLSLRLGMHIGVEGDLSKPITFNAAIGVFYLTIALLLPSAAFGKAAGTVVRLLFFICAIYAYAVETVQTLRGLDPRFPDVRGFTLDVKLGIGFGVVSVLLIALLLAIGIRYFLPTVYRQSPLVAVASRYAFICVLLACAAGLTMILDEGPLHGTGSMISVHFMGFHALQTIPAAAFIMKHAKKRQAGRLIHITGLAWLGAASLLALQAYQGLPLFRPSIPLAGAGICLLVWHYGMVRAISTFHHHNPAYRGSAAS